MKNGILITVVGTTDPIRGNYDGPILHIVRHYSPKKVVLILSEEIGRNEKEYHHNEEAIHLLKPDCEVKSVMTGITDVYGYDAFALSLLNICNQVKNSNEGEKIYLNISSGTPQMKTAFCMIAISDPETYVPIQVISPENAANKSKVFEPSKELVEEWFETDIDNEEGVPSRCNIPELLNFKRPILQFQILSLIQNYDYSGACQLYKENQKVFSEKAGTLLEHARRRLNLEHKEASALAEKLGLKAELYPVSRSNISRLIEFYNSMKVKQIRGELNDFAMRMEILTEYLGIFLLEDCMRVPLASITDSRKLKNSTLLLLSKVKCESKINGIVDYLNKQFADTKLGEFDWGKPISATSIVHIVSYLSTKAEFERYAEVTAEMNKWIVLTSQIRNPAAHTIISITEDIFRNSYGNKTSETLVNNMRTALIKIFGKEISKEAFDIYKKINGMIKDELEK